MTLPAAFERALVRGITPNGKEAVLSGIVPGSEVLRRGKVRVIKTVSGTLWLRCAYTHTHLGRTGPGRSGLPLSTCTGFRRRGNWRLFRVIHCVAPLSRAAASMKAAGCPLSGGLGRGRRRDVHLSALAQAEKTSAHMFGKLRRSGARASSSRRRRPADNGFKEATPTTISRPTPRTQEMRRT